MKESMRGMDFWGVTEELNVEKMKNEIFQIIFICLYMMKYDGYHREIMF